MEITLHAKLLGKCPEEMGYETLVFEDLEFKDSYYKYITCIKFPNWNQGLINIGDEGFLHIKYISAGVDTWFDGENFVPYKYTNIQFLKFIKLKEEPSVDLVLD